MPIGLRLSEKFKKLTDTKNGSVPEKRVIRRVPVTLRKRDKLIQYFKPRGVSIGPLHYDPDDENLWPAEELKYKLAMDFIEKSGYSKEDLYQEVESNIKILAEFYADDDQVQNVKDDLAWILFIDGCAILHFIHHVVHPRHQILKKLNIKNDLIAFAQQDLFLLENQLPFKLLELLMNKNKKRDTLRKSIQRFVLMNSMVISNNDTNVELEPPPLHIFDLLRRTLLFGGEKTSNILVEEEEKEEEKGEEWPTFRSIQELQAAGIYVKRQKTRKGLDITFKSGIWGKLKIPRIRVDDSTQTKLLNLVAYEMCSEFHNDFEVTSYICLLDSLIDQAEDVKELRKANVIQNMLGSDEQLATLFNTITTDLVPNPNIYLEVKKEMQRHIDSKYKKWIAEGYEDHFKTPWSILAFLGAITALALSFVQAWYSAHPAR